MSTLPDPARPIIDQLGRFGPGCAHPGVTPAHAARYVQDLTTSHYENFSVLSSLVPARLRADFAAVYAFCRWADDLGDETGRDADARERSLELLAWWRDELRACYAGTPRHPVFIALAPVIAKHALPIGPFDDLIKAFELDQTRRFYRTWEELIEYCRCSANPVGHLVLMLAGYAYNAENAERYRLSDATCTALQLINFWQDVRRDLLERDRVYLPSELTGVTPEMLRDWAGRGDDPAARVPFIWALRPLVERTRAMFEDGAALPALLSPEIRPVVWLFGAGGRAVLRRVEAIGCATLWQRPRLASASKGLLVARAWLMSKRG